MSHRPFRISTQISIWFTIVGAFLAAFEFFSAGVNASSKDWQNTIFNLFIAILWSGFVVIMYRQRIDTAKMEAAIDEFERSDSLREALDEATKAVDRILADSKADEEGKVNSHENDLANVLSECLDTIDHTGAKPTPAAIKKMEKMFHTRTGHYVQLKATGHKLEAYISSTPFTADKKFNVAKEVEIDRRTGKKTVVSSAKKKV
jgi:hypothetical protein